MPPAPARKSGLGTFGSLALSLAFIVGGLWMAGAFGLPPASMRYTVGFVRVIGWAATGFFGFCFVAILVGRFGPKRRKLPPRSPEREYL